MATYTTNYQLHQWEPEDPFLRTDFNTDLLKLDEGLTRQAEVSACLGYEALQSRLLTDAAGKPAADGRGLLFDSFRTGARAAFGGGCGLKNGGGVLLDTGTGLISFSDHYGADESYYLGETASTQSAFTAAGNGTLDSLSLYLRGKEGASVKLAIRQGSAELWSTTAALTTEVRAYTFQPRLRLQKGVVYTIYVQRSGGSLWVYCAAGGGPIGYSAVCTPAAGTSGTVTGALCSRTPCRSASAWVRHIGGNVHGTAAHMRPWRRSPPARPSAPGARAARRPSSASPWGQPPPAPPSAQGLPSRTALTRQSAIMGWFWCNQMSVA